MQLDIYKSTEAPTRHFLVPAGSDVSGLPEIVEDKPRTSVEVEEGKTLVGVSGTEALRDISKQGFHVVEVPYDFT